MSKEVLEEDEELLMAIQELEEDKKNIIIGYIEGIHKYYREDKKRILDKIEKIMDNHNYTYDTKVRKIKEARG